MTSHRGVCADQPAPLPFEARQDRQRAPWVRLHLARIGGWRGEARGLGRLGVRRRLARTLFLLLPPMPPLRLGLHSQPAPPQHLDERTKRDVDQQGVALPTRDLYEKLTLRRPSR